MIFSINGKETSLLTNRNKAELEKSLKENPASYEEVALFRYNQLNQEKAAKAKFLRLEKYYDAD